jgi:hypothetical protein
LILCCQITQPSLGLGYLAGMAGLRRSRLTACPFCHHTPVQVTELLAVDAVTYAIHVKHRQLYTPISPRVTAAFLMLNPGLSHCGCSQQQGTVQGHVSAMLTCAAALPKSMRARHQDFCQPWQHDAGSGPGSTLMWLSHPLLCSRCCACSYIAPIMSPSHWHDQIRSVCGLTTVLAVHSAATQPRHLPGSPPPHCPGHCLCC